MITILACLATVLIAGGGGFAISFFIQHSKWARSNSRSGEVNPNAGVCLIFSLFGGALVGVLLIAAVREFSLLPFITTKAMDAAYITALVAGGLGSLAGMMTGLITSPGQAKAKTKPSE